MTMTAARRLIRKESVDSVKRGIAPRCPLPMPSAAGLRHHHHLAATANNGSLTIITAVTATVATSHKPIWINGLHDGGSHRVSFSTAARPSRVKRSPHSKLLRVCSERNSNPHFAAIEADLLRLQWQESMDALVEDWSRNDRFEDFVELERNVREYVNKNLTDLTHSEKECVREWERMAWMCGPNRTYPSLSDHIRFHYFPYGRIIAKIVNRALAGEYRPSSYELKSWSGEDDATHKRSRAEIHGRIRSLSKAGKILDAMTSFRADDNGIDDATSNAKRNVDGHHWTDHHASCSDCHRSVLSAWFLLYRRLREANGKLMSDPNVDAAGILEATAKLDTHPEGEALVWAERWISFCAEGRDDAVKEDDGEGQEGARKPPVLTRGIGLADRPLLSGVVKILAVSENEKRRAQSVVLGKKLTELFDDE